MVSLPLAGASISIRHFFRATEFYCRGLNNFWPGSIRYDKDAKKLFRHPGKCLSHGRRWASGNRAGLFWLSRPKSMSANGPEDRTRPCIQEWNYRTFPTQGLDRQAQAMVWKKRSQSVFKAGKRKRFKFEQSHEVTKIGNACCRTPQQITANCRIYMLGGCPRMPFLPNSSLSSKNYPRDINLYACLPR